jgi:hypothetical protein
MFSKFLLGGIFKQAFHEYSVLQCSSECETTYNTKNDDDVMMMMTTKSDDDYDDV